MIDRLCLLFYGFCRQLKPLFAGGAILLLFLGSGNLGCGTTNPATGGINLPAPTADLEGGTTREATVCDTVDGAPDGAQVRIVNTTTNEQTVENLDASDAFSLLVCVKVGEGLSIQILDSDGSAISPEETLTRSGSETTTCHAATNTVNCP